MRFFKRPTLQTVRVLNFTVAAVAAGFAVAAENRWLAMFNAALVGFNLAAGFYVTFQIRMQSNIEAMSETLEAIAQLNAQLIANKVEIILDGGDPDEHRPSLH